MTYRLPQRAPYSPTPALDAELADLGYACIHGYADQRPITPGLVRSRLAAHGHAPPTLLATVRAAGGELIAAAALRYPAGPGGTGRLWGPLVRPGHQRRGLGRLVLDTLAGDLRAVDGAVMTAEIPRDRPAATAFFTACHWRPAGTAVLLKAALPLAPAGGTAEDGTVRVIGPGEPAHQQLAALYAAARPHDRAAAAEALQRWRADERFRSCCLVLAEHGPALAAAALVYPLAHTRPEREPAEALLGDLLIHPATPNAPHLAARCAHQALNTAADQGAHVARALVAAHEPMVHQVLVHLGFTARAQIHQYRPPDR